MRILADTSLWFRFARNQRQADAIVSAFKQPQNQIYLSPVSVVEIIQKWRAGKLPCDDPRLWLDEGLNGFAILPVTEPIARLSAFWEWPHKDPADRTIAATAAIHQVELWHTDTVLKTLSGFPHRYFKAPTL